jgi:serine/threonine protein kinase
MQTAEHDQENLTALQASLDAYLDKDLDFPELRTRWITALANAPEIRESAVRLLYQQPAHRFLTEERALTLKRIAEAAFLDNTEDWTITFEDESSTQELPHRQATNPKDHGANGNESEKAARPESTQRPRPVKNGNASEKAARPENMQRPRPAKNGNASENAARPESTQRPQPAKNGGYQMKQRTAGSHTERSIVEHQPMPSGSTSVKKFTQGDTLGGRFELKERLGAGGIGVVYKAVDRLRYLANERPAEIAVKILREEFSANPAFRDSLQNEALKAQGFSHPNIVRIHDFHPDSPVSFLTMELLHGQTLSTVFSRQHPETIPIDRVMRIISGMCRGLAYVHASGVVHGDFKPGNVFLTSGDKPKIMDFGLAGFIPRNGNKVSAHHKPASVAPRAVTPAYASCNRLEGGVLEFSDDVYSLCCVIYELLAGRHPFDRKSALVAHELGIKADRIKALTDVQWLALSTGLSVPTADRNFGIADLHAVFSDRNSGQRVESRSVTPKSPDRSVTYIPAEVPVAAPALVADDFSRDVPASSSTSKGRAALVLSTVFGILLGAVLVGFMTLLGVQPVPQDLVNMAKESALIQQLKSTADVHFGRSGDAGAFSDAALPEQEASNAEPPIVDPDQLDREDAVPSSMVSAEPEIGATLATEAEPQVENVAPLGQSASTGSDSATVPQANLETGSVAEGPGNTSFGLNNSNYRVREGDSAVVVKVVRQGDLGQRARIEWSTIAGTAEPQADFEGSRLEYVEFSPNEESATIFIPIVADTAAEPDETFGIVLHIPEGQRTPDGLSTATVTIVDDDF